MLIYMQIQGGVVHLNAHFQL